MTAEGFESGAIELHADFAVQSGLAEQTTNLADGAFGVDWIDSLFPDRYQPLLDTLLAGYLAHFVMFLMVACRIAGVLFVGPMFRQPIVPWHVRILIVSALALIVTPLIPGLLLNHVRQCDVNRDGYVEPSELDGGWLERFESRSSRNGEESRSPMHGHHLTVRQLAALPDVPETHLELVIGLGRELVVGAMIGFGIQLLLIGLHIAGNLIDQITGAGLGQSDLATDGLIASPQMRMLALFGFAAFLAADRHLVMFDGLLDSFRSLPPGDRFLPFRTIELLVLLPQQSLGLAMQVAAPFLAMTCLLTVTLGLMTQAIPQLNVMMLGIPIRAMCSLLVLVLVFSGVQQLIADRATGWIESVIQSFGV